MRRLRRVLLLVCLSLLVILCGCNDSEQLTTDNWGSFTNTSKLYSYDEAYYSIQTIEDDTVIIRLYNSIDDELICQIEPCRSADYWGMVWERDRYAFWVQSGDIGVFCIELEDGEWVENWDCERPEYIESRYD